MYKKILWIMAFSCSLLFSQSIFANSWGCGEGMKQMLQSLKLTDDQKTKIQPILDQLKTSVKTAASQMGALETQISQQVTSATMDQGTLDGLVDQKAKLIGDMMKAKLTAKNQIIAILTPEQKTAILGMMKKLEDKIAARYKDCHDDD